jgi:hypothetical protein
MTVLGGTGLDHGAAVYTAQTSEVRDGQPLASKVAFTP